ncbi:MAG: ComEC/Rec2 family competence protein [Planctomycetes bacterium]|nr:ComEC/Rec2 family competence protein [Planctomycetota bacterium]
MRSAASPPTLPPLLCGALLLTAAALLDPPVEVGLASAALLLLAPRAGLAAAAFWIAGLAFAGVDGARPSAGERPFVGALRVRADSRALRHGGASTWVELHGEGAALPADAQWIESRLAPHVAGDWFTVEGTLALPAPPRNPGERAATARLTTTRATPFPSGFPPAAAIARSPALLLRCAADRIAGAIDRGLATALSPTAAALARALALGRADRLARPLRDALRDCGGWHLIAVSGSHVVLLAALLEPLLPRRWPRSRSALLLLAIASYVVLCGAQPPVVRAGLGYAAFHLARRLGYASGGQRILAASFLLLVATSPEPLADVGLQLSFAAVFALEVAARYGPSRSPRGSGHGIDWRRPLGRALRSACFAAIATAPLTAFHFGTVAWIAPLATLLLAPLVTVGLATSLVAAALAVLSPPLLGPFDPLLRGLDGAIGALADALAALPATPLLAAAPSTAWSCATLLFWIALALRRPLAALGLALGLALWPLVETMATRTIAPRSADQVDGNLDAAVTVLDVGHGQAVLLREGRRAWLVDAGGHRMGDATLLVDALVALAAPPLEGLLLSHLDADHCSAAADLLARWPIATVWLPPAAAAELAAPREPLLQELAAALARAEVRVQVAVAGDRIGPHAVVWPPPERRFSARNDGSLALLAQVGGVRWLLPGDLEGPPLVDLAMGLCGGVDALLLPHHGGADAGLFDLMRRCGARRAIASRAETELPESTLRALERLAIPWRSTARSGALLVAPSLPGALRFAPSSVRR